MLDWLMIVLIQFDAIFLFPIRVHVRRFKNVYALGILLVIAAFILTYSVYYVAHGTVIRIRRVLNII